MDGYIITAHLLSTFHAIATQGIASDSDFTLPEVTVGIPKSCSSPYSLIRATYTVILLTFSLVPKSGAICPTQKSERGQSPCKLDLKFPATVTRFAIQCFLKPERLKQYSFTSPPMLVIVVAMTSVAFLSLAVVDPGWMTGLAIASASFSFRFFLLFYRLRIVVYTTSMLRRRLAIFVQIKI